MAPATKQTLIPVGLVVVLLSAVGGSTAYMSHSDTLAQDAAEDHCEEMMERHIKNANDRYARLADVAAMSAKLDETARRIDSMSKNLRDFRLETREALEKRGGRR